MPEGTAYAQGWLGDAVDRWASPWKKHGGGGGRPNQPYAPPTDPNSPYGGLDPKSYFGDFGAKSNFPRWMQEWSGPAKYAMGPSNQFSQDLNPLIDFFRKEAGSDIYGSLMERSRGQIETQGNEAERSQKQSLGRAGYGSQGASPMDAFLTQTRMMAGAGQMGLAAQTAELMARQYRSEATANLHNLLSSRLQAQMIPAHLQASRTSQVPVSGGGPGFLQGAGSFLGGLSGFA